MTPNKDLRTTDPFDSRPEAGIKGVDAKDAKREDAKKTWTGSGADEQGVSRFAKPKEKLA